MDMTGGSRLLRASRDGDVKTVKEIVLLDKADINIVGFGGKTPLFLSAEKGHVEIVQLLLQAGADISLRDCEGNTALSALLRSSHVERHNEGLVGCVWSLIQAVQGIPERVPFKTFPHTLVVGAHTFHHPVTYNAKYLRMLLQTGLEWCPCDVSVIRMAYVENPDLLKEVLRAQMGDKMYACNFLVDAVEKGLVESVKVLVEFDAQILLDSTFTWQCPLTSKQDEIVKLLALEPNMSLMNKSRWAIRKCILRANPWRTVYPLVQLLPLPKMLQAYLCFENEEKSQTNKMDQVSHNK